MLKARHIILCCLLCLLLFVAISVSQTKKLQEIANEQTVLTARHEALLLEEQRLRRMIDYAGTDEYLQQYVRERFGYVLPGEYKFYEE
jgi:cell division protein FtsB